MSKINLIYGVGDVLHTHLNINPFAEDANGKTIIRDRVDNLDKYADDGELEELVARDVLDYLPLSAVEKSLENWAKKIKVGGKIVVGGVDLYEVCSDFSNYKIGVAKANFLIHGKQDVKSYLIRKSNFTALGLSMYFEQQFGFSITKKIVSDYQMCVEAIRKK